MAKRFLSLMQFQRGLNSQASPFLIDETTAVQADNVRFNERYGALAKRKINLLYGSIGAYAVEAMHRYYKADTTKRLMSAGSTKLFVGSDSLGTFQTIGTGYSDGKKWQFVTYKDIAIGMNGFEKAIKYDGKVLITANTTGARTAENLVAELGAPFAELKTGTALAAEAWYMYKVVFYDGENYWHSTARSNAILTGADVHAITLTDVPIGPEGTTHRYIYRTLGNATRAAALADTTYYMVKDLADNSTTTFDDTVADNDADADNAPTWATAIADGLEVTPPLGKLAFIHDERLFISGNTTYQSDVYFSDSFNPNYFDPTYYSEIRPDDGDKVAFLKEQLGILTIGKTNTIQKMYTDGSVATWSVSNPFSFIGCPAPYSAANTPDGIFYLAWKGLYKFTGQNSVLISDATTPEIADILQSSIDKAVGFFYKNEYHLAYTSRATGGTLNNRVLVYDIIRDAYSVDTKSIASFVAFNSGDDFGVLHHGSSTTDGKVYADDGSTSGLQKRYKSEVELGTFDDTRISGEPNAYGVAEGEETDFWIELGWDTDIDNSSGTIDAAVGIIDRPDTDGTWLSPIYEITASELTQIQWHEVLGDYGNVTFAIKTNDEPDLDGASWSSEFSNPNGSDLTAITAGKYIQIRISLSTTNIEYTPKVTVDEGYLFRVFYKQAGAVSSQEPDVLSTWKSGFKGFDASGNKKLLQRMRVFYKGETGTINVKYENLEGDCSRDFDIDMAVNPTITPTEGYKGRGDYKVFEHYPAQNSADDPAPTGEYWQLSITHTGNDEWTILGVEIQYEYCEGVY